MVYLTRAALLTLSVATSFVFGSPIRARSTYEVKETHNVPSKWSRVGPAPGDHLINLSIGLKQSQFDELERHLYEGTSSSSHHLCLRYSSVWGLYSVTDIVMPTSVRSFTWSLRSTSLSR